MSGTKPDILWAPHQVDRFVVCDSELSLYHVESAVNSELKAGSLRLSEDSAATLLSINSDTPYMKCVAWYLNYDPECLLAVGQANGRVVLTSLGQDHNSKFKDLIGKEFVPKHARQCNTLAWNPLDSNWLAAGLDKHRADFSVLIWDICSKYTPDIVPMEKVRLSAGEAETTLLVTKPLYELGQNDASLSLCWLPRDQKLLLAGMHRNLAIFDLRNTSQKMFVNTKAVQGVTVDPYFHDRVASFYEGQVAIWDLRKFEKPVLTLTEQPKPLTKVAWCPTRTGLLATLTRDSNIIRLYDMQHTPTPIGDETEPTIIERSVQPCDNYIASFAWHPTSQNRMIVVTPNRTMSDFTVFERISLAWSPITSLMWACGRHLYECAEEESDNSLEKDIATKMRLRALSRYGLDTEQVWRNHILAGNEDPQLKSLWYTLHFMKQYTEDNDQKSPGNKGSLVYAGIKSIVKSSLVLSQEENELGKFLRSQGFQDKTRAGKMMQATGKALCFSSQQRLALRNPLCRFHQEVETFRHRAISDTWLTVNRMEQYRTEYRGALLWMKDVSQELDPDLYKQMEKFRKVQTQVRLAKKNFDKLKMDVCQKVDLLGASRCNLLSHMLATYQTTLLHFWEKTSHTMAAIHESFKGYQPYEFTTLKSLQDPMKKLVEKEGKKTSWRENREAVAPEPRQLISLEDEHKDSSAYKRPIDELLDGKPEEACLGPTAGTPEPESGDKDDLLLLNEIFSTSCLDEGEFSREWAAVFGDDQLKEPAPMGAQGEPDPKPQIGSGFLPSQLLDQNMKDLQASLQEPAKAASDLTAWFSLFADLDPLSNPDAVGKTDKEHELLNA